MATSDGRFDAAGSPDPDASGSSAEAVSASCSTKPVERPPRADELPVHQDEAFGDQLHMRNGGFDCARRYLDSRRPQLGAQRRGVDAADATLLQHPGQRHLTNPLAGPRRKLPTGCPSMAGSGAQVQQRCLTHGVVLVASRSLAPTSRDQPRKVMYSVQGGDDSDGPASHIHAGEDYVGGPACASSRLSNSFNSLPGLK